MLRHAVRFGLVGAMATLVHMLIGVTLVAAGWPALAANPISFLIAFVISFMGHYGFSFSDQANTVAESLKRFTFVACGGFVLNEALLAALVLMTPLLPSVALLVSTGAAATATFFASRNWAFRTQAGDLLPDIGMGSSDAR